MTHLQNVMQPMPPRIKGSTQHKPLPYPSNKPDHIQVDWAGQKIRNNLFILAQGMAHGMALGIPHGIPHGMAPRLLQLPYT